MRFIPLVAALAIHAIVLILLHVPRSCVTHEASVAALVESTPIVTTLLAPEVGTAVEPSVVVNLHGGGGAPAGTRSHASARVAHVGPWAGMNVHVEAGGPDAGDGRGGLGSGRGIGFGDGGGFDVAHDVPAPPPAPPPSLARPAKLLYPTRDLDVEDEAYLFVARVTVDREGAVIGVRMVKTHPGSRAERAASAIWTFRYRPALDDGGAPVRATFEQAFQVR